ncbi:MAG: TadE-like protein [Chloroflexi bacterium]|nr:TadE-like protein [Chloroflexota bacterium]
MKERRLAQSTVEFALMIPLFLGVILAIFDTAHFMATYASIANGVRSGARVATVTSSTDTQITDAVVAAVVLANTTTVRNTVAITCASSPGGSFSTCATRTAGNSVKVTATYPFAWNPLFASVFAGFNLGTTTISQQATMTVESP